ncbi:MAG: hypothetical protein AVDCRST_MAG28-1100 [uncultured Rubrobacteraceae bacterium]|uniref:Uncharacterized protein n=1 Tax=uncultured Rubrobacteraceae bacterium TaxID=349277 RepID=A0A6J4QLI0_9ACTN|nr:MAG: hypothetical protein AVDCRST_MAG28-1100 [uncultured Rubrobacteraceae bacterium]
MSGVKDQIRQTYDALVESGDVTEIRAFGDKQTVSGYFDNGDDFVAAAHRMDLRGYEVYVTLNRVDPALFARAANRTKERPKNTTSDRDVLRRQWLLLDFDCVRPSGVSSTEAEKEAAELRAREVREYLRGRGWPDPVVGDSGNGYHLLYRIDLPNDQESTDLVKNVLQALAFRFDDEKVKVDTSVYNAARISKVYGTMARKGDDVPGRPHRRSELLKVPTEVNV